ncbi:HIT family protein [Streptomyces sp. NBC_00258]|uniref:HIT family protein n=1 Tax=Streptomyces sp. NBC_00258 TaxID=2903642 RepID=UPI003FA7C1EA
MPARSLTWWARLGNLTSRASRSQRRVVAEPGCLFCMREDASLNTVLRENGTCYVRLDNYPAADGHVEVVPKRHIVSFFELTPREVLDAYALLVESQAEQKSMYQPDGYTIGVNEGRAAGRTIDHLHIHLVPRHDGDVVDPRGGIRQVLPGPSPDAWAG